MSMSKKNRTFAKILIKEITLINTYTLQRELEKRHFEIRFFVVAFADGRCYESAVS